LLVSAAIIGVLAGGSAFRAGGGARAGSPPGEALASSTAELKALSEHLRKQGVLFYGAWWCPACFQQKNLFGKEAGNRLPYVECDKSEKGRERCKAAGVRAFPTWVMGDSRLVGVQTIETLKSWSGFPGN
jgi:glutaredoxin